MKNKKLKTFYLLSVVSVLIASAYPLYMGIHVVAEMLRNGAVQVENYPKYIIPYTPISIAVIVGVLLIPLSFKFAKRFALPLSCTISLGVFFLIEHLMETKILVQAQEVVYLESWQMSLCYIPPEKYQTRTWEAVDILLGGYSPAFKFHFYIISVVLIVSLLNCFYGFAKMIQTGDTARKRSLIVQVIASGAFLGMCIWACFTSFYRTGEITVSSLSAVLMSIFFILFGVTMGVFVGSFLLGRNKRLSVILPSAASASITLIMYIGEMILLSGHLYRFGIGFLFNRIRGLVLAPIDIIVVLLSGCATAVICFALNKPNMTNKII